MVRKLLLNQARNADSDKSNMTVPIEINTNRDIIVDDQFEEVVNQYNVYLDEREQCTKVRLTANVNILASNIIFNSVTEIVKNEGSDECECLNITPKKIASSIGKSPDYEWGGNNICDAVMDTQISYYDDNKKNYTYLCGIDIINNHILRAKSKYPIYQTEDGSFNTINDLVADRFGEKNHKFASYYWFKVIIGLYDRYQHRYTKSNIMTFDESLQNNLINNDGWVGFYNKGLMGYSDDGVGNVINNETKNKFIDLFPGRDRYTFLPHYNKYRNRYEKNWEYCLTYPSGSTTSGIDFINRSLDTLKIAFIDETEPDDDSVYRCKIYTVSKHGLNVDDTINLYRSKEDNDSVYETVEENLVVDSVIDDYVFTVYTSDWVCKKWISVFDKASLSANTITHAGGIIYYTHDDKRLMAVNNYVNADFDIKDISGNTISIGSQNLSFAKVVDDVQCRYYVRLFSRFPNFDFYDKEVTEENVYGDIEDGKRVIDKYSDIEYEKQSTETKLGFSKNAYGDNIGQIVFNDDIDISVIKDNLGRPLTSLYLTFFKTNYGRKEWYGKYSQNNVWQGNSPAVEWSRCFGKLNCGFEYSPYIDEVKWGRGNIRVMNNVSPTLGLTEMPFNGQGTEHAGGEDGDEILYKEQNVFYGDLCMYSPSECLETVIQDCLHRFNTMQRETGGEFKENEYSHEQYKKVYYDDIIFDDYSSSNKFTVSHSEYETNGDRHPEGYFYRPSYEVPIRTFSSRLREFNPRMIDVVEFSIEDTVITARTVIENYFNKDTNLYLYDSETGMEYMCDILNILDVNIVSFTCSTYPEIEDIENKAGICKLYAKNVIVPSYAEIVPGKSGSYRWRDLVQNGFEESDGVIQEYPFVNGCFYVHTDVNLFLRRQDPFGEYGMASNSIYFGLPQITGERNPVEDGTADNTNDAIKESDIKC